MKNAIVKAAFELQSFGVIEKRSKIEKGKWNVSRHAFNNGSKLNLGSFMSSYWHSLKGAVSWNSAKLGKYKMPVKLRET